MHKKQVYLVVIRVIFYPDFHQIVNSWRQTLNYLQLKWTRNVIYGSQIVLYNITDMNIIDYLFLLLGRKNFRE